MAYVATTTEANTYILKLLTPNHRYIYVVLFTTPLYIPQSVKLMNRITQMEGNTNIIYL